ncbi:hypothetical protein [Streptomyces sp. LN500]|uniref:hypothetical protein n=1 Tax=Streptomyces sp. LN500 TaxID=3112978 RepID=UPI003710C27F
MDQDALPPECQRILAIVCDVGGAVTVKQVGEVLGLDVAVRGKLEPLRGKLSKRAGRGWLRKLPDGRFTARLCSARPPLRGTTRGVTAVPPGAVEIV